MPVASTHHAHPDGACIDVRTISPPARHPLIFGTFDALVAGESFEIVNDHDPLPLYMQFERARAGQFSWRYLQSGPALWHVQIARRPSGRLADASTTGTAGDGTGCGGSGRCRCG